MSRLMQPTVMRLKAPIGEPPAERTRIERAMAKLGRRDAVGQTGELLGTIGGAAAGASAAGAIAGAAGGTTLLGSSALAGALGGLFVTATPVGWVIGAAAVAGAAGYGIVKLARSGGKHDEKRRQWAESLQSKLKAAEVRDAPQRDTNELRGLLARAQDLNVLSEAMVQRTLGLVLAGRLDAGLATRRARMLLDSTGADRS
jgi:hypothetical protein